jgi:hypothetical protein
MFTIHIIIIIIIIYHHHHHPKFQVCPVSYFFLGIDIPHVPKLSGDLRAGS